MSSEQKKLMEKIKSAMIKTPEGGQESGKEAAFANMAPLKLTEEELAETQGVQSAATFWEWVMEGEWWFSQ